ncbi:MAG: type II toxin-antitoxin system ParD family antitoxin [Gemmataceae bacterium]
METTSITISLPERLKQFVDSQIALGRTPSLSEFIESLLNQEEKRQARERVEDLLQEGLDSGPGTPMTAGDWDKLRQRVRDRLASPAST